LSKSTLSTATVEKRNFSSINRGSTFLLNQTNFHVKTLQTVWEKRFGQREETWEESRISRITGTSAKIVMLGKNKPTAQQLSVIFGLSTFNATTQMQIGNVLESKMLQVYSKHKKLQFKKDRGGRTLTLLYQYN
jgi:hypothetical protein